VTQDPDTRWLFLADSPGPVSSRLMAMQRGKKIICQSFHRVEVSFYFLIGIALPDALPLVEVLLPLAQPDLQLGIAFFTKVSPQWNDRITFFFDLIFQLAQLPLSQQQLTVRGQL